MDLAKPCIDVGLATNGIEPVLAFWQGEAGLAFDHVLKLRRGHEQHRHDANGSVVKINHNSEPLPDNPPSGYREVIIARPGLTAPLSLVDPDGARVRLVPPGHDGVTQIGVRLAVRDVDAHRAFYRDALGLVEEPTTAAAAAFRAANSLILIDQSPDAPSDSQMAGPNTRGCSRRAAGKPWRRSPWELPRGFRWSAIPTATGSNFHRERRSSDRSASCLQRA